MLVWIVIVLSLTLIGCMPEFLSSDERLITIEMKQFSEKFEHIFMKVPVE